jgi:hypothetical protein
MRMPVFLSINISLSGLSKATNWPLSRKIKIKRLLGHKLC